MRTSTRLSERVASGGAGIQKLKISFKSGGGGTEASGAPQVSFLGEYDRELDENPEEPLCFEEQFILRVPKEIAEGKNGSGGLREMVKGKGKGLEGVEFKFLDSRRAAFKFGNTTYAAKLVDLPNIIESQKTFDNRHLFKIADISQMLVVDHPVTNESSITAAPLKIDEYIWPHGITPPMRHVRKRRFRKRMSRLTIEVVEETVEDLMKKDEEAVEVSFDFVEAHPDPDIDDQYYIDYDPQGYHHGGDMGSDYGGSEIYDDHGSVAPSQMEDWGEGATDYGTDMGDGETGYEGEEGEGEGEDGEGTLDQELAAALMQDIGSASGSDDEDAISGSDDDEDDDDGDKSEYDEETLEKRAKIKQFTSEIKALEAVIDKKRAGFTGGNPIMVKRFEETISGLQADVTAKITARQALVDEMGQAEEGANADAAKQAHDAAKAETGGQQPGSTAGVTPMDVDADMDEGESDEGEGETEGPTEGATPATETADRASSPQYSDEGDLFGDDDDGDEDAEGEEEDGGVESQEGDEEEEDEGEEEEDDAEDEMAALLRAELEGMAGLDAPADGGAAVDMPVNQEEADAAATAALNDFAMSADFGEPDMASVEDGFANANAAAAADVTFVEGGVGHRRWAQGVVGDGNDSSSDDSDD